MLLSGFVWAQDACERHRGHMRMVCEACRVYCVGRVVVGAHAVFWHAHAWVWFWACVGFGHVWILAGVSSCVV